MPGIRSPHAAAPTRGRCRTVFDCLVAALAISICAGGASVVMQEPKKEKPPQIAASEYERKAAFLEQFLKFAEWPDSALPKDAKSIVIGVLGPDPFGKSLDALNGKSAKGRTIEVRRYEKLDEVRPKECHLLFLSSGLETKVEEVAAALAAKPVLLVGDSATAVDRGAQMSFVIKEKKIAFEVNLEAVKKTGISISSKLLKLAVRVVKPKEK